MENLDSPEVLENEIPTLPQRSLLAKLVNRLGCLLLFIIWLMVMAMPCFFVTLVVEKEIVYKRSDLPEDQVRLFLLDDPDQRGFGLQIGGVQSGGEDEGQYCVATSVDYLMWKGEAKPVNYCNCYMKLDDQWIPENMAFDEKCEVISQPDLD